MKIKVSTIARIGALLVALANQGLAIFGRGELPFTENMTYQVITLVATIVLAVITAWKNNDITKVARLAGEVFDSLKDGKITEEEIETMLKERDSVE